VVAGHRRADRGEAGPDGGDDGGQLSVYIEGADVDPVYLDRLLVKFYFGVNGRLVRHKISPDVLRF
jgi:hypothetical protein